MNHILAKSFILTAPSALNTFRMDKTRWKMHHKGFLASIKLKVKTLCTDAINYCYTVYSNTLLYIVIHYYSISDIFNISTPWDFFCFTIYKMTSNHGQLVLSASYCSLYIREYGRQPFFFFFFFKGHSLFQYTLLFFSYVCFSIDLLYANIPA